MYVLCFRDIFRKEGGQILREGGVAQLQKIDLILLHKIMIALSADPFHNLGEQQKVRGALLHRRARFKGRPPVRDQGKEPGKGMGRVVAPARGAPIVGQPGGVPQQRDERNGPPPLRQFRKIAADRLAELQQSPLMELHHRDGGKRLR